MGDSVDFYNQGFSLMSSKIQDLWNTKIIKGHAKTLPSNLVKEYTVDEQSIGCCDLIPKWAKQEKYIKIIQKRYLKF